MHGFCFFKQFPIGCIGLSTAIRCGHGWMHFNFCNPDTLLDGKAELVYESTQGGSCRIEKLLQCQCM